MARTPKSVPSKSQSSAATKSHRTIGKKLEFSNAMDKLKLGRNISSAVGAICTPYENRRLTRSIAKHSDEMPPPITPVTKSTKNKLTSVGKINENECSKIAGSMNDSMLADTSNHILISASENDTDAEESDQSIRRSTRQKNMKTKIVVDKKFVILRQNTDDKSQYEIIASVDNLPETSQKENEIVDQIEMKADEVNIETIDLTETSMACADLNTTFEIENDEIKDETFTKDESIELENVAKTPIQSKKSSGKLVKSSEKKKSSLKRLQGSMLHRRNSRNNLEMSSKLNSAKISKVLETAENLKVSRTPSKLNEVATVASKVTGTIPKQKHVEMVESSKESKLNEVTGTIPKQKYVFRFGATADADQQTFNFNLPGSQFNSIKNPVIGRSI